MIVERVNIYIINFFDKFNMSFLASEELNIGDYVIAETSRGMELGVVSSPAKPYVPQGDEALTFIVRKADEKDFQIYETNLKDTIKIQQEVQQECNKLNLNMRVISCEYTLDRSKLMLSYLAEERVDFRELLKVLASMYHTRIELRQIGARDKAKMIGGIGVCGLPLCCATFLHEFDGISITMAKNQMLALNIPKLSGQCGKLMCCLKYENSTYDEEKKNFPRIGLRIKYNGNIYRITSMNILTRMVRLESPDNIEVVNLDTLKENMEIISNKDNKN